MSDLHIGCAFTDHDRIESDLKLAREVGARVLINGDVFDAILPGDVKRFSPTALAPRLHNRADILNASLEWGVEILEPYRDLIGFIGVGNHDTALEKHHSVDLVAVLCDKIQVPYGGYCGYYIARWIYGKRAYHTVKIRYHHGAGGSSPVTKGIIDFARMAAFIDGDSDVCWIGHKHNRLIDTALREQVTPGGKLAHKPVLNIMSGAYLETYRQEDAPPRRASYAADKNLAPQSKGGVMLELDYHRSERTTIRAYCV